MNTAEQIIAVILAGALAVFLGLAIAAIIVVLRFVASLRRIADKAEHVVDSAGSVAEMFKKATGPMTILHFVKSIAEIVAKQKEARK